MKRRTGFTLIEMSVVVAVIGILYMTVVPIYGRTIQKARETSLRESLYLMRKTLDGYYRDHGAWPKDLPTLVTEGYLRAIPIDPLTKKADTWKTVPSADGNLDVFDVRSGAEGRSLGGEEIGAW